MPFEIMDDSLLKSPISTVKKNVQIQDAQILSDDKYFSYFEETKDVAQRRSWTFYEAIKVINRFKPIPLMVNPKPV